MDPVPSGLACPECGQETTLFESAANFEKIMVMGGKEVEWRDIDREIVVGCTHCVIGWK